MNEPDRNAIGTIRQLAIAATASGVSAKDADEHADRQERRDPGDEHRDRQRQCRCRLAARRPAASPRPTNSTACSAAIASASDVARGEHRGSRVGVIRISRSRSSRRHCISVNAAPNTAALATPHDSTPGAMYWM